MSSSGNSEKTNSATTKKKQTNKKSHRLIFKVGIIFTILLLILALPAGWVLAYKDRVYPNVKIADIEVGGLTYPDAKSKVASKIEELQAIGPVLVYEDQKITPTLTDLGVSFNSDDAALAALKYGREETFKSKILSLKKIFQNDALVEIPLTVDHSKIDAYVAKLTTDIAKNPVNASISVVNGQPQVKADVEGVAPDKNQLIADLTDFVSNPQSDKSIDIKVEKVKATLGVNDTGSAVEQANAYLGGAPITITYNDLNWVADRNEVGSWLKFTPSNTDFAVAIDPSAFIGRVGKQVEKPAKDREVQDGTGTVLNEGQDGLGIDSKILAAQIKTALENSDSKTISLPVYNIPRKQKTIYPHSQPGRYEGHYIDVNLSEQKLYAYDGQNLMNSFLISSGLPSHPTPTGEFHIWGKSRVTTMDGPGYYLPGVQWVSWVVGDYSIHGTYWHHNFGHPMSHGCINASNADAEWVYNFVQVGTPVYIHR